MSFEEAWGESKKIPGWLSEIDAKILWQLCSGLEGPVVEVGSFLGRSSVLISHICDVVCIDPWIAGLRFRRCIFDKIPSHLDNLNFMELFLHYTSSTTYNHRIKPIRCFDYDLFPFWRSKIDLLFLDHVHTKNSVVKSLLGWRPYFSSKSRVLVHDSNLKEVMDGLKSSKIKIERVYNESEFAPALCVWPKIHA